MGWLKPTQRPCEEAPLFYKAEPIAGFYISNLHASKTLAKLNWFTADHLWVNKGCMWVTMWIAFIKDLWTNTVESLYGLSVVCKLEGFSKGQLREQRIEHVCLLAGLFLNQEYALYTLGNDIAFQGPFHSILSYSVVCNFLSYAEFIVKNITKYLGKGSTHL